MLMILDGWGIAPASASNAISQADTPFFEGLLHTYPHTELLCSGEAVGLPQGVMGNSEVGHLNIGAGRIVDQDLVRIDKAIEEGGFFNNDVLAAAMDGKGHTLHLMGLVSDGGVHSHLRHLLALLKMAKERGARRTVVHAILDGRDTAPDSGVGFVEQVQKWVQENGYGQIATLCGRYYAMDRDKRWDRTERAYRLYTRMEGTKGGDPVRDLAAAYERGESDEFVKPIAIYDADGKAPPVIGNDDRVIFFNFRADRARQISRVFTDPVFSEFDRRPRPALANYTGMTLYDDTLGLPVAFPQILMEDILGEVVSRSGRHQLRIAETEKYAHVTYFFNGGEEPPFPNEDRCLVPSPREVPTYDKKPEMSAVAVTTELLQRLASDKYDLIVLNFANGDMVGHTGNIQAAIKACETVDRCLGKIVPQVLAMGGTVLITADHGNAEKMREPNGKMHTAHTQNPVPFILVNASHKDRQLRKGILGDIAPTILALMGLEQPAKMTGRSLLLNS
jgi:2,3-bisphosphoglycerate-independent phosphoglycerate mutase